MLRAAFLAGVLTATAGCSSGSLRAAPDAALDAPREAALDGAPPDGGSPEASAPSCDAAAGCVQLVGGDWSCPSNVATAPVPDCPAGSGLGACTYDGGCLSCNEGTATTCDCVSNGTSGVWRCYPAGASCEPGGACPL